MNELNGLILIGGKSSRMGEDKGKIVYHKIAQQYHIYHVLATLCHKVYFSCNKSQIVELDSNYNYIPDNYDNIGPLGGLLSAFEYDSTKAWLVLACDMPYVNKQHIQYLIGHRDTQKLATTYISNNRIEPLFTIWESQSYQYLKEALITENYSLRHILKKGDTALISIKDKESIINVNTPEEKDNALDSLKNKNP